MELENYLYVRSALSDDLFSASGIIETPMSPRGDRARALVSFAVSLASSTTRSRSNFHKWQRDFSVLDTVYHVVCAALLRNLLSFREILRNNAFCVLLGYESVAVHISYPRFFPLTGYWILQTLSYFYQNAIFTVLKLIDTYFF